MLKLCGNCLASIPCRIVSLCKMNGLVKVFNDMVILRSYSVTRSQHFALYPSLVPPRIKWKPRPKQLASAEWLTNLVNACYLCDFESHLDLNTLPSSWLMRFLTELLTKKEVPDQVLDNIVQLCQNRGLSNLEKILYANCLAKFAIGLYRDVVLNIYSELQNELILVELDEVSTRNIVNILCLAGEWEEALSIVRQKRNRGECLGTNFVSKLITYAIKKSDLPLAEELIRTEGRYLPYSTLISVLESKNRKEIELLLDILVNCFIHPRKRDLKLIVQCLLGEHNDDGRYSIKSSYLPPCGVCSNCSHFAVPYSTANLSADALKSSLIQSVELEYPTLLPTFERWIQAALKEMQPFDILICASAITDIGCVQQKSFQKIMKVIDVFERMNKRVAVLLRENFFTENLLSEISERCQTIAVGELLPEIKYSTIIGLHNSLETYIISSHSLHYGACITFEQQLLRSWLQQRTIRFWGFSSPCSTPILKWPYAWKLTAEKTQSGWHLPNFIGRQWPTYVQPNEYTCISVSDGNK